MLVFRYLTLEILLPFVFSLVLLGSLMSTGFVFFNLVDEMVRFNFHWSLALKVFCLRLPEMLFYTIPMGLLLSTMLAASRLSHDYEIVALRLCGLSILRIFFPFGLFSILIVGLTILLNETTIPSASWLAKQTMHFAKTGQLTIPAQKENLIFLSGDNIYYARFSDGKALFQVSLQKNEAGQLKQLITAKKAAYHEGNWVFEEGQLIQFETEILQRVIRFQTYQVQFDSNLETFIRETRSPLEMSSFELKQFIQTIKPSRQSVASLEVRLHQKLAIPFSGMIFVCLGFALGVQKSPGQSQAFGLSILVVFCYYFLMASSTALGDSGQLPVWLAAWLPNIIVGLIAGGLLLRLDH